MTEDLRAAGPAALPRHTEAATVRDAPPAAVRAAETEVMQEVPLLQAAAVLPGITTEDRQTELLPEEVHLREIMKEVQAVTAEAEADANPEER